MCYNFWLKQPNARGLVQNFLLPEYDHNRVMHILICLGILRIIREYGMHENMLNVSQIFAAQKQKADSPHFGLTLATAGNSELGNLRGFHWVKKSV